MVAVTRDEPDVDEIERLISMDASLSFGLLKMANSAYFALRHRATTIHQAIMTLGLGQLKQWIYLLSASNMDNVDASGTEEFLKLSFMRASFCSELMKHAKDMPISRSEAYLMGMFSTLNQGSPDPQGGTLRKTVRVGFELRDGQLECNYRLCRRIGNSQSGDYQHLFYLCGGCELPVGPVEQHLA